jgi:RNA polymerase sigma factor (TIGR02999 family)
MAGAAIGLRGGLLVSESGEITQVLLACREGGQEAFDQLVHLVYDDLRRIAHRQLQRSRPGQMLNTTSLVNEAYLKLVDQTQVVWRDRSHFLAVSARAMRHIIVDATRHRSAAKRGGEKAHIDLEQVQVAVEHQAEMLLMIDRALDQLAALDERLIRVVECRFFAGFTEEETAAALAVSVRTVQRDWKRARAWLKETIKPQPYGATELATGEVRV